MKSKMEKLSEASELAVKALGLGNLTNLFETQIRELMRQAMDRQQLQMFDLALFCETEMLKADEAGAHMAACLMGAAMNEALIALMCLKFEDQVVQTKQFGYSIKKAANRSYKEVVADWSLQQLNSVVEECGWITKDVVDNAYKQALADGFRELMPITRPEMTSEEVEAGAITFIEQPATALLRFTQDLRNAIHAGKWLRGKSSFDANIFSKWCQFSTHLCAETRLCLLHQIMEAELPEALEKILELNRMLDALPSGAKAVFEKMLMDKISELNAGIEAS